MSDARFSHDRYLLRRNIVNVLGAKFRIFGPDGQQPLMFGKLKAFKFKEDIRLFGDEALTEELLLIQARQVIDFSAAYDVVDAQTAEPLGTVRRRGMRSLFRDEWQILDDRGDVLATVQEDSMGAALLRRFIDFAALLWPQAYTVRGEGQQPLAEFKQNFNPFVVKINADFSPDREGRIDRRLGLAAALLMCAIEGKQS